jgi:hypothetical protein
MTLTKTKSSLPGLFYTNEVRNDYATILGFGPAGGGKTFSIQTILDEGFKPVVIACELGQSMGFLTLKHVKIPAIPVDSHVEFKLVMAELQREPGIVQYDGQTFDFVIMDSFTERGERWMEAFRKLKGWDEMFAGTKGIDPRQAYSYVAEKGRAEMRMLFNCAAHLFVVCRERTMFQGESQAQIEWPAPDLPGQALPNQIPGLPDATVRLRRVAGQHIMATVGMGNDPTRVRVPGNQEKLPSKCLPNIGALAKYMSGDATAITRLRIPKK